MSDKVLKPGDFVFVGLECLATSYDKNTTSWFWTMDTLGIVISSDVVKIDDEDLLSRETILCLLSGHGLYYVPMSCLIKADKFDRLKKTQERKHALIRGIIERMSRPENKHET